MNIGTRDKIIYLIASLDTKIKKQISSILSLAEVADLLTAWTGLYLLCRTIKQSTVNCHLKLLDITWKEIDKDINSNLELDESALFKQIYEEQFGVAGGEPFSLLLVDYQLDLRKVNVVSTLSRLGEIGEAALAPIITNVSSLTFGQASYEVPINFSRELNIIELTAWQRTRHTSQARFINIVLPQSRIKLTLASKNFYFKNLIININGGCVLTLRIIQSFQQTLWFNEILGFFDTHDLCNGDDNYPLSAKSIEVDCQLFLNETDAQKLTTWGFIPLVQQKKHQPLFFTNNYCAHTGNDLASLLLEHILAACRFAHIIKIIARNKIGLLANEQECEKFVSQWLKRYTASLPTQSLRYQYPLKTYQIKLSRVPGKIGYYTCQILLEPHMKLENMSAQILLHSEILSPK